MRKTAPSAAGNAAEKRQEATDEKFFKEGLVKMRRDLLADHRIGALARWVFQDDLSLLTRNDLKSLKLSDLAAPLFPRRKKEADLLRLEAADLKQRYMWRQLETLFAENHIDYCPIKGADLAWRVWPRKTVRRQSDLDVLIRSRDRQKVLDLLARNGWEMPYREGSSHHDPMLVRQDVVLEMHFMLPHFGENADNVWTWLIPDGVCRYRLPLEINLTMLFCHCRGHHWVNLPRLLLDCGFLVKAEGVPDWEKERRMADAFGVPSCALLFAAFPDFFPAGTLPDGAFPPQAIELFRRLFSMVYVPDDEEHAMRVMAEADRFSGQWWKTRLRAMRPEVIRQHIQAPRGAYGKLLAGYFRIGFSKLRWLWRYSRQKRTSPLDERMRDEKEIEKYLLP